MVFVSICTALYDYAPQGDNELELREGDLVYILEKSDEDDWWKAKKRAASEDEDEPVGLIPNNYVQEVRLPIITQRGVSTTSFVITSVSQVPGYLRFALYEYSRQTDEELSFSEDATLDVYDNKSDPEWTLVGLHGEYGFAPANYIEIMEEAERQPPSSAASVERTSRHEEPEPEPEPKPRAGSPEASPAGPAAALARIMHGKSASVDSAANPTLPPRRSQYTPDPLDEDPSPPSLPQRPPSEQLSPPPTQYASPRIPTSPGIVESPPYNRAIHPSNDDDEIQPKAGGFHLYNISEMISMMGKSKKLPTTLGLNLATGEIMIAPEKSRDGPTLEWTAEKLTHYSIEGKHVFMELVRPSKSIDFHAGTKDTAQEIVAGLGEIAGASRAEGLREVLEAAGSRNAQKKGQILYDFMAQGDDEVTVAVGDEVIIVDDTKSDEWWMVRRIKNGKEGVVPSSYVEVTGNTGPPPSTTGINAGKSIVQQNRAEEERLAKQAVKASMKGAEVGPGVKLPARGSSLTSGDGNQASQRSKKDKSHGRSASSSKSKPDVSKTRTWTDRSGAFKVEAQFIGLKDGKIHLHKLNGVKIAVPVVKMAIEDLEYVEAVTGQSLEDDKPLSDIKRRSTQSAKGHGRRELPGPGPTAPKAGASIEQPKPPPKEGPAYDWFDFFLKAGVSPYQCERYAYNFNKDSMDENVLSDITPSVLRTLGLKEGDILRVMKYLDTKFGRTASDRGSSPDGNGGGLFSGPGGALLNNTRKGRPAPAVQSSDIIDDSAFKPRDGNGEVGKDRQQSISTSLSQAPAPPMKDSHGFDDDAWDVKPSKKPSSSQTSAPPPASQPAPSAPPQQKTLSENLLDLSLLSPPLQPTPVQNNGQQQPSQTQNPQFSQPPPQPVQQQPTGANPSFFSQLRQPQDGTQLQQQPTSQPPSEGFNPHQNIHNQVQPQQIGAPRQRPQAPVSTLQGSLMPPPPARPLSAPQTQPHNNAFGLPPLQPQLTGYQPQTQIVPPGQSLNELNQQRSSQQPLGLQQQHLGQQQLQPQQTGFMAPAHNLGQFNNSIMPQPTVFGPNPYINGQQAGSPFADPRVQQQQTGFQTLPPQVTGYQPLFQPPLQMQSTGVNSMLPPALQPQQTGAQNGASYSRPGFGQPPTPIPPIPPMPPMPLQQPAAMPLQPQKTGPAPPVRFGTPAAKKLVPQPTGRKANLSAATRRLSRSPSLPYSLKLLLHRSYQSKRQSDLSQLDSGNNPQNMSVPRAIRQAFLAIEQSEGAGARVRRSIGTPKLHNFSPFLMLDHFTILPGAGFPDHPHRGQETITYLLQGAVDHEDFAGNKGTIETGDLQFMTAGRGIMHAEMPRQNPDGSANVGIQLWVDLPEKLKTCEPRYRDLRAKEIPIITVDDGKVTVKIISGQSHGTDSVKELAYTPVWIFDIAIKPGGKISQDLPGGWNAFAYTLSGSTTFGVGNDETPVGQYHNVVFERKGDGVQASVPANAKEEGRFILVAGLPLDQKVVQYGPFVLNSQEEVYQAMMDYQTHSNGFERAKGWESEIGKSMVH
ncbi:MAG: hypothetical protein Q9163_003566 [Psora crenata]